jgi:septum formation protein
MKVLLASTSRYRRELLSRLRLPFECIAPDVDETPIPDELPEQRALRLAQAKAAVVAATHPHSIVIGSDQVAALDGLLLRKPHTQQRAQAQLRQASAQHVDFYTALCIRAGSARADWIWVDHTRVRFRCLADAEINRYLEAEQPYDCAGSFKCEGLGISLFEAIESTDPTALIGLPLIAVSRGLRELGLSCP